MINIVTIARTSIQNAQTLNPYDSTTAPDLRDLICREHRVPEVYFSLLEEKRIYVVLWSCSTGRPSKWEYLLGEIYPGYPWLALFYSCIIEEHCTSAISCTLQEGQSYSCIVVGHLIVIARIEKPKKDHLGRAPEKSSR